MRQCIIKDWIKDKSHSVMRSTHWCKYFRKKLFGCIVAPCEYSSQNCVEHSAKAFFSLSLEIRIGSITSMRKYDWCMLKIRQIGRNIHPRPLLTLLLCDYFQTYKTQYSPPQLSQNGTVTKVTANHTANHKIFNHLYKLVFVYRLQNR